MVIDTPPILLITDALVLMKHVDRALLVAHVKRADLRSMRQLEGLLEQNIGHVSMVLNGIVLPAGGTREALRYLYSYGYEYGSYGGYGYGDGGYGDDPET